MRKITYKKAAAVAMAAALSAALLVGCGSTAASTDSAAASTVADESTAESTAEDADEGDADEVAAKNCADLIDAIYVQERSADTDAQCEAAKAAWDALTDTQKELVEGENADPDYFGRDTGDASKDDPRNADDIGENELLVVSFGTSFNGSRAADIKGIEDALQAAYPDWSVRRAFTAQIIINHVQARDGEKIDNMDQALDRAVANGVKNLVVQPTHLMHGAEYDEMCEAIEQYRDKFDSVAIAEPLLGEVGEDATVINADKEAVAAAITAEAVKTAGYDDAAAALPDGVYTAKFNTDSSMFHANEAVDGMGTLTVENGTMTFHVSLQSQKIVNLYPGMAADAPAHESDWLQPTVDTVTYSDGTSDEVYGFDIPVAAVDADFQLAILGTKGTWYDHTVSVSDAEPAAEDAAAAGVEIPADGSYTCAVTLEGGSGRATVESPAALTVADGIMTTTIVWSSPNYDYMLVDGEKYLPVNTDGNSTFEIPVAALDTALAVTADTVAMSTPHEIDYTLTFDSATLAAAE